MPLMSGVELSRELRRMSCPVFIAGCTGNALREDRDEYLEAGSDEVLTKPIKEVDVRRMVEEARLRIAGLTKPKELGPQLSEPQV